MHYTVSYENAAKNQAIKDLFNWLPSGRRTAVTKYIQGTRRWWASEISAAAEEDLGELHRRMMRQMNGLMIGIEMAGVSGEPVRALMKACFGEALYDMWMKSPTFTIVEAKD